VLIRVYATEGAVQPHETYFVASKPDLRVPCSSSWYWSRRCLNALHCSMWCVTHWYSSYLFPPLEARWLVDHC